MEFGNNYNPSDGDVDVTQGRRGGKFRLLPILLFVGYGIFYYFSHQDVVPLTGRKHLVGMNPAAEMQLGLQSYSQVLMTSEVLRDGPELNAVRSVGQKIAKATENSTFEWEFNVLHSPDVNAFCLPGGKVAVYTGILPVTGSQDGLAVVMGHEIAHAIARHGAERMAQETLTQFGQMALGVAVGEMAPEKRRMVMGAFGIGAQFGVLLPFSREHESEADYMGLIYMARACFNPEEAPIFWERMMRANSRGQPPEFMSTHPSNETRIAQLKAWLPEAMKEREKYCGATGRDSGTF